jgi:multidrug efflux system outer membrane protein
MRRSALATPFAAVSLLALGLGGCSLEPGYRQPDSSVSASYPTGDAYKAVPAGSTTPAAVDIGWRNFFDDPRLQQLIALGLANNRNLRVAILDIEEAKAHYRIERAALLPNLEGNAAFTRERTPADLSPFGVSRITNTAEITADSAWEIDLFGKTQSLTRQALDQYLSTAEAREATQIALVSQIANQYLTLLSFDALLDVTRETLVNAEASYKLTQVEFRVGNETALDLAQSESVVDQANANLASEIRQRAQAWNDLELLVGTPLPADLPPGRKLDDQNLLTDVPPGLPSDLLTRRPDIVEAEDTLRAANANIGVARAAFFPSISLTGEYGTGSSALSGLFGSNRAVWSFGPSVNLPIFEGGSNFANLQVAKAQQKIAVAQYQQAIQTAFQEVSDDLAARGTYDDQIQALIKEQAAEQVQLDLSSMLFREGIDNYLAVLTAQLGLYSVQQTLISTRLARLTSLVDLYQDLGGGWIEHTGDQPQRPDAPLPPIEKYPFQEYLHPSSAS